MPPRSKPSPPPLRIPPSASSSYYSSSSSSSSSSDKITSKVEVETRLGQSQSQTTKLKRKRVVVAVGSTSKRRVKPVDANCKEEEEEEEEEEEADKEELEKDGELEERTQKQKRKPKTTMALPLASRNLRMKMLVGAHVSMAEGIENAVTNAFNIGGNAFALFVKSHRRWVSPAAKTENVEAFKMKCREMGYDPLKHILPHGSYLVNLGQPYPEKAAQAYECFVDDLKRCEMLGVGLYNFHPGSTCGLPRKEALARVSNALNRAHQETRFCKTVLENMAGSGNTIGTTFEDLRDIISGVKDKNRVGVCLDTCHLFAAGFDIRTSSTYSQVMTTFSKTVGINYLVALHLNDSKSPLGSHRDLHQNIGLGHLGLEPFRCIMNDPRLEGLPLILETPKTGPSTWAEEIKLLEGLVGVQADDEEFLEMAERLKDKGQEMKKKEKEMKVMDEDEAAEKEMRKKEKAGRKAIVRAQKKAEREQDKSKRAEIREQKRADRKIRNDAKNNMSEEEREKKAQEKAEWEASPMYEEERKRKAEEKAGWKAGKKPRKQDDKESKETTEKRNRKWWSS